MKYFFKVVLLSISPFILFSCKDNKELQIIFPLGICSYDVLNDEQITTRKALSAYLIDKEVQELLVDYYELDNNSFDSMSKEVNLTDARKLENLSAIVIKNYIKDGVQYERILLFFKDDILIQVHAIVYNYNNISFIKRKINQIEKIISPRIIENEETFSHYGESISTFTYEMKQFNINDIYLEIENEYEKSEDELYYTYYNKKICPLNVSY